MNARVDTSPVIADEVKFSTCYMCACRCGIKVHLNNGRIRYIQGNPDHPVNKGVLCAKGSAGIMQQYSPAKLTKPLIRVGERGSGEFREIEWEEAISTAVDWLKPIRETDPKKLAFFTGRDQSQALTGWWATQFGTPNYAAHGGFCSVNMATGGIYSIGGSFWEFGEPDWERTKYLLMFGVAEDHDSNPIKTGLAKIKKNGAKFASVNPVRTGYSAIADEWIPIAPGSDGLFALSLAHELLKAGKVDLPYLVRYTNAPWLVVQNPGGADDGMFARDEDGNPLCWDQQSNAEASALLADVSPAMKGDFTLADGRTARPVFHILAERYLDDEYSPDNVAARTGLAAKDIRRIAAEIAHVAFEEEIIVEQPWTDWAGRRHERMIGRPVSMHAMRGISAHSNGFHTCRALHLLQMLLGTIDVPGGFRYKPPFPRAAPFGPTPAGKPGTVNAGQPMGGPPLGFPRGPEDLVVDAEGQPIRIDKAFSWDAPLACHGMMHTVIGNAHRGDPYSVDVLFMFMANMGWNSSMSTQETIKMLTDKDSDGEYKIPKIIYSDAYFSETVPYADLILPDTTYLERWDCISMLDRPISGAERAADSIRQPVIAPDRDVRPFQDVLLEIGVRLGLPGMTNDDGGAKYPGGYSDYIANHERAPGVGSLMGWRGENGDQEGKGVANPDQLQKYVDNGCFWEHPLEPNQLYYKHANKDYLELSAKLGFNPSADPVILQLYSEPMQKFRLAAQGHGAIQPPEEHRVRVETYFDPLPFWYAPLEDDIAQDDDFPLHAITQRPAAMYHSWGSMNAWLRQIHGWNPLYIPRKLAKAKGIETGDWVYLSSRQGRIKAIARVMDGVNENTVWTWNAIGKRKGAWNLSPDAEESNKGFLLNHLIDELLPSQGNGYRYAAADPVTGQAAWYDLRVRLEKAPEIEDAISEPQFPTLPLPPGVAPRQDAVAFIAKNVGDMGGDD
jgi:sulfite dehydrogenase (quinone) subunit SoeA